MCIISENWRLYVGELVYLYAGFNYSEPQCPCQLCSFGKLCTGLHNLFPVHIFSASAGSGVPFMYRGRKWENEGVVVRVVDESVMQPINLTFIQETRGCVPSQTSYYRLLFYEV